MSGNTRITLDPNILVGKPIIKGTRIAVEFVLDLLGRGWTAEQVLREYDHLTPEDIQACLGQFAAASDDRLRMRPHPSPPSPGPPS